MCGLLLYLYQFKKCTTCSDKYVSRAEYDELKMRVDRLEAMLSRAQLPSSFTPQPGPESSSSQLPQQQLTTARPLPASPGRQGTPAQPPLLPYHPISPPGLGQTHGPAGAAFPGGVAGPSRTATVAQDYSEMAQLRAPNSPAGRTALPPLASLGHGPAPFDGPPHPPRLHREHREHREQQHQPYASPPQPPLQQPLQQLHQQTKNYHAQTLTPLGERLRHCITLQGPAAVPRLHHHPYSNNNSSNRRLRLLVRGVRGRRHPTAPAYRSPLLFCGRQHYGVQSVRSENGS